MNFSDVMREESKWTKTENGADAKNTTDSALLDMFATIGAMRTRSEDEIVKKFVVKFYDTISIGQPNRCSISSRVTFLGLGSRVSVLMLPPSTVFAKAEPEYSLSFSSA